MESNHEDPELKLSFDPRTIEHLGFKMYSRLPNAVAELVANSYDADATHVEVVVDTSGKQSVRVTDDGHGMSPQDLADKYLRIGRNRRAEDMGYSESGKRRVAGRKGLGKLALFGIGTKITIRTKRAGAPDWKVVTMTWEDLRHATGGDYVPGQTSEPAADPAMHGTAITVEELKRKTQVDVSELASSLAQLFNYVDEDFKVTVSADSSKPIAITKDLRYGAIEEESRWKVPFDVAGAGEAPAVFGVVIAAKKPLRQELRGLTIYVKGRLANDPEFFGVPESSYAYSYITGYIEADYLDDQDEDVVATDRRSINWDSPEAATLRDYLAAVLREVARLRRGTRRMAKANELREDLGVDVGRWTATIEDKTAADSVRQVLEVAVSPDTELSPDDRETLVHSLMAIAPEYADMHWRSLHPDVQAAAETLYKTGHYFHALLEAIKRYAKDVRTASSVDPVDLSALQAAFGNSPPKLDVAGPYLPSTVTEETADGLRTAQRVLSEGLWRGFRNPIAHQDVDELENKDVFSYQDCLDALSILSHLRRRVDKAAPPSSQT
ncbi:TIGR02391 family protein [Nocardioides luteus]|nr:TIGR02391 family protein [Nocardioides luteus]